VNLITPIPAVVAFPLAALALGLAACAGAPAIAVPAALAAGANESLAMVVPARGVQIYQCRAKGDSHEWAFVAPDAELLDARGNVIGQHGAGPTWRALDGSQVSATLKARADAPVAGAIPWLLLAARDTGPAGAFSGITSIQRVNTAGGLAPATPCTGAMAGKQERVRYTADYRLFTIR
jgi:hypothetical protein